MKNKMLGIAILLAVVFAGCSGSSSSEANVTGISISREPYRNYYFIGESIDLTGLSLLVTYDNSKTETLENDGGGAITVSNFSSASTSEDLSVTISYGGQTASYSVSVNNVTKANVEACISALKAKSPASVISIAFPSAVSNSDLSAVGQSFNEASVKIALDLSKCAAITAVEASSFINALSLQTVTLPATNTSIGEKGFNGCVNLTAINIPDKTVSIGVDAFSGCAALSDVTFGTGLNSIGERAFKGCTALVNFNAPASLQTIGVDAFEGCSKLETVELGASIATISNEAFQSCANLTSFTIKAVAPPALGTSVFDGVSEAFKIYAPSSSVSAYQTASNWATYSNKILAISAS